MRTGFNLDGARIKALRIQRGWTQEQLAEIAGISSRTIQRAESANCAAFDTVRAVAGAFDVDFGQLLAGEPGAARPAPLEVHPSETAAVPDGSPAPATGSRTDSPLWRRWTTIHVGAALAAGVLAGVFAGYHLLAPAPVLTPSIGLPTAVQALTESAAPAPVPSAMSAVPGLLFAKSESPDLRSNPAAPARGHRSVAGDSAESGASPDLAPQSAVQWFPQQVALHAPPSPRPMLEAIPALETPLDGSDLAAGKILPVAGEPTPGAVRQALEQTRKKLGGVFAGIGSSVKRVF